MEDGGCRFHPGRSSVAFRGGSSIVEHHENIRRRVNPRELPPEAVAVLTECRVPPRLEAAAVVARCRTRERRVRKRLAAGGSRIRTIGPAKAPGVLVLSFSFTPTFRLARMRPTNPISKACVARDRWFKSGFLRRRCVANPVGNPALDPSLSAITCGGARPPMQPKKLQAVRPVDPLPGRQWKLLKINVSESMLSPSLPISLHARRSPSAAGRLDRESKWQSFRFVTAYAATQY